MRIHVHCEMPVESWYVAATDTSCSRAAELAELPAAPGSQLVSSYSLAPEGSEAMVAHPFTHSKHFGGISMHKSRGKEQQALQGHLVLMLAELLGLQAHQADMASQQQSACQHGSF